jgi:hypothetical protein
LKQKIYYHQDYTCAIVPLWPIHRGERKTTFAKTYGVKKRWSWERVEKYSKEHGEQIGNMMRTHWEPDGNTLRMRENEKKLTPTPYPNPKGIKSGHLEPTQSSPL